jgi:hypothetical protein
MALKVTLLDLVTTITEFAETEAEVIATVVYLVNSGKVTLCGNFRGARFACEEQRPARKVAA